MGDLLFSSTIIRENFSTSEKNKKCSRKTNALFYVFLNKNR